MPEYRFGRFLFDSDSRRLFRAGREIAIQEKPAALLHLLLEQPGVLVARDAVTAALWPDTHVALADNLNTTISKLRACLQDKAVNPTFIETVPRRGYRFIAPVPVAASQPAENKAVRRAYDQGRFHLDRLSPAARQLAKNHFQQAVSLAPDCHLGYAGLVEALLWEAGMLGDTVAFAKEIVAAQEKATALAPDAVETQLATALVAFLVHWDYPRAERLFQRLTETEGNEAARGWYAAFLLAGGRFDAALAQLNAALEAQPLSQTYQHQKALAYFFQGDRARSRQQLDHLARTMDGGDGVTHWLRYHHKERWASPEEAVSALQHALTAWGFPIEAVFPLSVTQRNEGPEAMRRQLITLLQEAPGMRFTLILLHAQCGELDNAFALIDTALALRDWNLCYLSVEPRAANLRDDSRFAGVLQNLLRGYLR